MQTRVLERTKINQHLMSGVFRLNELCECCQGRAAQGPAHGRMVRLRDYDRERLDHNHLSWGSVEDFPFFSLGDGLLHVCFIRCFDRMGRGYIAHLRCVIGYHGRHHVIYGMCPGEMKSLSIGSWIIVSQTYCCFVFLLRHLVTFRCKHI